MMANKDLIQKDLNDLKSSDLINMENKNLFYKINQQNNKIFIKSPKNPKRPNYHKQSIYKIQLFQMAKTFTRGSKFNKMSKINPLRLAKTIN